MTYSNTYSSTSSPTNFIPFSGMGMRKGGRATMMPSNYQGDGSTLNLDFTTGVLDPRLSFSRASPATFVNSSGYVQFANANCFTYSNPGPGVPGWNATGSVSWIGGGIADPIGGTNAQSLLFNTAASAIFNTAGTTVTSGITHTFSVWLRAASDTTNARIGSSNTGAVLTVALTTTWQRFSCQYVTNGTNDGGAVYSQTGTASTTMYVWGAQVQPGSIAGDLIQTSGTQNYSTPRFDNALLTSRTNLILQSNNFSTSPWAQKYGTAATLTSNYTVAGVPDGFSGTATRLQSSVAASGITQPLSFSAVSGKSLKFSLYIKSNTTANQVILLEDVTGGGTAWTATPVWQRFSFSSLISITKFALEGLVAGLDISICGAQVEYVNTGDPATAYIPTTTSTVSVNTTEPRGLLIEGQVQNYMLQSQSLSGLNPYAMIPISIDGTVPDPMGGAETKKIAANGTTNFHAFLQYATVGTATTVTVSIFAKKNGYKYLYLSEGTTNTAAARFNLETGVSDTPVVGVGYVSSKMTPYPNGWWRCEMVANITAGSNRGWCIGTAPDSNVTYSVNGTTYLGTNNSNDGIYAIGWQVEPGSGATSYIPTGASGVQRNADICYIPISAIGFNTGGGTFFTSFYRGEANLGLNQAGSVLNTDYADTRWLGIGSGYGSTTFGLGSWNVSVNQTGSGVFGLNKAAGSYASWVTSTTGIFTVNGATAVSGTLSNLGTTPNYLMIGSASQTSPYNGLGLRDFLNNSIKSIKYFPTAKSAAELQTLTAP